jgi:hypothetical protein
MVQEREFNESEKPVIAVFNKATVPLGAHSLDELIDVMQVYVDEHIVPRWATPATLQKSTDYIKGAWALVFLDNADVAGALAYHDLTADGLPLSKVFVKTTTANGELVSVSASHELVEMLVDPAINMMSTGPLNSRLVYSYEAADPVEAESFAVNGIQMSNFVYPSYFEAFRKTGSVKFDEMGLITKPFEILTGGYQIVYDGRRWKNIFASKRKEKRFAKEDRRGHRSEMRKMRWPTRRGGQR